jgi:hypothetical protein
MPSTSIDALPTPRLEVQHCERTDRGKTDPLQRQCHSRPRDSREHLAQRRTHAGKRCRRGHARHQRECQQRQQCRHDRDTDEPRARRQRHAQRRAGRQRAVDRHADPGHDLARARATDRRDPPGQHAGDRQAFAGARKHPPQCQPGQRTAGLQRRRHIGKAGTGQQPQAQAHRARRFGKIADATGIAARQHGGDELQADDAADHDIAEPQHMADMHRQDRQYERDGQAGDEGRQA